MFDVRALLPRRVQFAGSLGEAFGQRAAAYATQRAWVGDYWQRRQSRYYFYYNCYYCWYYNY